MNSASNLNTAQERVDESVEVVRFLSLRTIQIQYRTYGECFMGCWFLFLVAILACLVLTFDYLEVKNEWIEFFVAVPIFMTFFAALIKGLLFIHKKRQEEIDKLCQIRIIV